MVGVGCMLQREALGTLVYSIVLGLQILAFVVLFLRKELPPVPPVVHQKILPNLDFVQRHQRGELLQQVPVRLDAGCVRGRRSCGPQ